MTARAVSCCELACYEDEGCTCLGCKRARLGWYSPDNDHRTGYATENVVAPTDDEADAMASWLEAIDWTMRGYETTAFQPSGETR